MNLTKFVNNYQLNKSGRILPVANLVCLGIIMLTYDYFEPASQLFTPKQFDRIIFTCFSLMLLINSLIYFKEREMFWKSGNYYCYLGLNVLLLIYLICYPRFFPFLPL